MTLFSVETYFDALAFGSLTQTFSEVWTSGYYDERSNKWKWAYGLPVESYLFCEREPEYLPEHHLVFKPRENCLNIQSDSKKTQTWCIAGNARRRRSNMRRRITMDKLN
jgi:hypothetical protein